MTSVKQRFQSNHILSAFSILNPQSFKGLTGVDSYGHMEMTTILRQLCGTKHKGRTFFKNWDDDMFADVLNEFGTYKVAMSKFANSQYGSVDPVTAWNHLSETGCSEFPYIMALGAIYFTLPVHTAAVERGFSLHRLIKHRLRSRLRIVTLDALMRTKLLSPKLSRRF